MDVYIKAFQVIYEHLTLAFYAALVFGMGFVSSFVVVRGRLNFLMRFPLWFAARMERVLASHRAFITIFLIIFIFNSVAMFLYMLSGVVDMLPAVIDFLTGMNIGIVMLAKRHPIEGNVGGVDPPPHIEEIEFTTTRMLPVVARSRRQPWIIAGFFVVTALELPSLWISIAMGIGLCHFAQPDGAAIALTSRIAVRALAYILVIVPVLAVSALAETISLRMMQADIRELGA